MLCLVQHYVRDAARRVPDKPAVVCAGNVKTYAELEARTNAVARRLIHMGAAPGSFVPFFMKKGIAAVESLLSVLKAGCAYVPLDAASPAYRLREILAATRAPVVIVDRASEARLRELCGQDPAFRILNIDDEPDMPEDPLEDRALSIDVAYALFTSGSTGTPKGVMISHRMITDYIDWCVETYEITERDQCANHAPLYFDLSTFDLYTAFKAAATLHLVHDELNVIVPKLVPWLQQNQISVLYCVPSVLTFLLKSGRLVPGAFPRLRHVIAAGEVLRADVVRAWMELCPHVRFSNMYGPTEITVTCTHQPITELPGPELDAIPIGKPRRNMQVLVMREDGSLSSEPGAEGELVVRGASVAYGYLNDAQRTRAAFVQNPRHELFHDPLYRTGDLGRIGPDGTIHFLGRCDQQIKYMGYRIELGEIEGALIRIGGVVEGVAVFNDGPSVDEKCIGALVCLAPGATKEEVVRRLGRELPPYMTPRKIVVTEELPHTPNGKIDRNAARQLVFGAA